MSLFSSDAERPLVAARDLVLAYGGHEVLRDVTLRIMPGETWFMIGPNGAGKTTLVKAMLGLVPPRAGSLALARELDDRRRLGFVPQRIDGLGAVPTTVREFTALGCAGLGLVAAERHRRCAAALAQVGLEGCLDLDLDHCSGGQRQRAAIARALVRDPLLLVVDEPTNGLDWVAARDLMDLLDRLTRERHLTTVFVAHDLDLVARHASHVALVARGTVAVGDAAALLAPERIAAAWGVVPVGAEAMP